MIDPARSALSEAYALYLSAAPDETFRKKDSLVKSLVLRQRARRIRYDKDRALILSLPNLNVVTGSQTRVSRIDTTNRCAQGMWAGKVIAAAENQTPINALWLRYVYDPYLDVNPGAKAQVERKLYPLLFGLWCFWPRRKTPAPQFMAQAITLFECVIRDGVIECRTGLNNRKSSSTYKSEQMGFGVGKSAYQKADYSRAFAPMEQDIRALIKVLDRSAIAPVVELLNYSNHTIEAVIV